MACDGLVKQAQWEAWLLGVMTPPDLRPLCRLSPMFAEHMCMEFPKGRNWAWYCIGGGGKALFLSDGGPQPFWSKKACALDKIQERLSLAAILRPDANCIRDPREFGAARLSDCGFVNVLAHEFATGNVYFWPYSYAVARVKQENGLTHSVRKTGE